MRGTLFLPLFWRRPRVGDWVRVEGHRSRIAALTGKWATLQTPMPDGTTEVLIP